MIGNFFVIFPFKIIKQLSIRLQLCYNIHLRGVDAMRRFISAAICMLIVASGFCGCSMRTVDQMYAVPKRSAEYQNLQLIIDEVMAGMEYSAPLTGENQQTVQMADLVGNGNDEYLLFARGNADDPLKIFVFSRNDEDYALLETIESRGTAFELVEYADIDGNPGAELVVGVRVSEQVLGYLTVYSFESGHARQLMTANYAKFLTSDLDEDGRNELMVIAPGDSQESSAMAVLYSWENGSMVRSREASLSAGTDQIKRIMTSKLHGGAQAVYVASALEENTIITDVFTLKDDDFTNISLSGDSGTSVRTLRNYYVYAVDIDGDGILELPSLIDMRTVQNNPKAATQHLIRWFSLTPDGETVDKMHTFHNFDGGWYMTLDADWASRVSVTEGAGICTFYVWDAVFEKAEKLLTVYALTGSDRELEAQQEGRFILYKTEGVVYAATLEVAALSYGVTEENLLGSFHMIHMDWKTGET